MPTACHHLYCSNVLSDQGRSFVVQIPWILLHEDPIAHERDGSSVLLRTRLAAARRPSSTPRDGFELLHQLQRRAATFMRTAVAAMGAPKTVHDESACRDELCQTRRLRGGCCCFGAPSVPSPPKRASDAGVDWRFSVRASTPCFDVDRRSMSLSHMHKGGFVRARIVCSGVVHVASENATHLQLRVQQLQYSTADPSVAVQSRATCAFEDHRVDTCMPAHAPPEPLAPPHAPCIAAAAAAGSAGGETDAALRRRRMLQQMGVPEAAIARKEALFAGIRSGSGDAGAGGGRLRKVSTLPKTRHAAGNHDQHVRTMGINQFMIAAALRSLRPVGRRHTTE